MMVFRGLSTVPSILLLGLVAVACVNAGSAAYTEESAGLDSSDSKGSNPMTTEKELVRVAAVPPEFDLTHNARTQPALAMEGVDTLDEALDIRPDGVFVPPSVSEGFSLQKIEGNRHRREVTLEYRRSSNDLTAGLLILTGGERVRGMPIQEGNSESVEVREASNAEFIRGMWYKEPGKEIVWNRDMVTMLMFYRNGDLVTMIGMPAAEWPKDKMLGIANSLENYVRAGSGAGAPGSGPGGGPGEGHGGVSAIE